jgi:hypothetical protein
VPGGKIEGDQVQRDGGLLQPLKLQVPSGELAYPRSGTRWSRRPARPLISAGGRSGRTSMRRSPRQMTASASAVATVAGREARNAAFRAPAEVPTSRSGAMPLIEGVHHPGLHRTQGSAACQHERGARRTRRTAGYHSASCVVTGLRCRVSFTGPAAQRTAV